jgi:hypothetical protein
MGIDAWTRHPYERKMAERSKNVPKKSVGDKLKDAARDFRDGTKRCGCGCGKTGTAFRGGKLYHPSCVGSKWNKAGLPQDRTPPQGRRWS